MRFCHSNLVVDAWIIDPMYKKMCLGIATSYFLFPIQAKYDLTCFAKREMAIDFVHAAASVNP